MDSLRYDIRNDFEYAIKTYSPSTSRENALLSEYDVMKAHYFLSDFFLAEGESVRFGILNYGLLSSAVNRQRVSFGNQEKWITPFQKIATLIYGLTKNHAFNDGNKRTALLVMLLALKEMKRQVKCSKKDFEALMVRIAANKLNEYNNFKRFCKKANPSDAEVLFIADFIQHKTRKTDTEFHSLTYADLNRKLRVYDVWLDNPQGNVINVYKKKSTKRFFGLHSKSQDERILQIGFKGWKCQVFPKALKSVLQAADLTAQNGIDSRVFYYGEEPEYKLIEEYYSVLKRLKDK